MPISIRRLLQSDPICTTDFIASKTALDAETYGDVPGECAAELGSPDGEWDAVGEVTVLRSCVFTPHLAHETTDDEYWNTLVDAVRETLSEVATGD